MRQFVAPEWDGGAEIISAALRYSNGENLVGFHVERANDVLRRFEDENSVLRRQLAFSRACTRIAESEMRMPDKLSRDLARY